MTCVSCRTWSRPPPASVASAELADTLNKQVECDLLFVHKHIIFHLLDRCTRWHAAVVIENKESATLIKALDTTWVTIHGPP